MQETIHGYPIQHQIQTAKAPMSRAGRFVLVDRGPDYQQRWVVGWQGMEEAGWDREWSHGHYFETRASAWEDLISRAARERAWF